MTSISSAIPPNFTFVLRMFSAAEASSQPLVIHRDVPIGLSVPLLDQVQQTLFCTSAGWFLGGAILPFDHKGDKNTQLLASNQYGHQQHS